MKKIIVAMSGGVDSSVAALLLKNAGFECIGVTMKLFDNEDIGIEGESTCCSLSDVEDARAVSARLGMPYYVFNFSDNFRRSVIDRFISTYLSGGTPNPCIDCNRCLKFEKLYMRAQELYCDGIATGHYARIGYDKASGIHYLRRAADPTKDQSYVLYSLTSDQLARTLFPLGELSKKEVREIAEYNGFVNAKKRDSQDICFVPDGDYAGFIERATGKACPPGRFIDEQGNVIGRHRGHIHYTIGQRRGLGISSPTPLYVARKDVRSNTVTLTKSEGLFSRSLDACDINLVTVPRIESSLRVKAKVRYRQEEQPATVWQTGDDRLHIEFDEPQRAIAAGQAVVLYDGDIVVGGGTII